ncbi:hypothetical protein F5X68DRAFT_78619 [Plectosphaerella plurivora]|uniref:Uncharacterized protein n=1 Tax=Plectosphaerella plurivora TaxID=936078 RepID=A0A9P8VD95_9PEZI|nr:hypothetical protein F5X68DRAFT_78619 [Plectosphaerella plurivora]
MPTATAFLLLIELPHNHGFDWACDARGLHWAPKAESVFYVPHQHLAPHPQCHVARSRRKKEPLHRKGEKRGNLPGPSSPRGEHREDDGRWPMRRKLRYLAVLQGLVTACHAVPPTCLLNMSVAAENPWPESCGGSAGDATCCPATGTRKDAASATEMGRK